MSLPNEIRIIILGDCAAATNILHTFNRERIARPHAAHAIPGTADHIRSCTVDDIDVLVLTREKDINCIEGLHCFEHHSPPDGFVLVYDTAWPISFRSAEIAMEQIVSMTWGPRFPQLDIPHRRTDADLHTGKKRQKSKYGKFTCFSRLPYELQIAVLRACLSSRYPILDRKPHLNGINTTVLLVNRFFHREGTRIFQTENRFLPRQPIYLAADAGGEGLGRRADWNTVSAAEGRALADRFGCAFFEVSSASDRDVDGILTGVVKDCLARETGGLHRPGVVQPRGRRNRSIRSVIGSVTGRGSHMFEQVLNTLFHNP
ncbi:hypothetical protein BJX76DRAFT_274841 [Aspergillus varians]